VRGGGGEGEEDQVGRESRERENEKDSIKDVMTSYTHHQKQCYSTNSSVSAIGSQLLKEPATSTFLGWPWFQVSLTLFGFNSGSTEIEQIKRTDAL
jgi:hypothetical protein